MTMSPKSFLPSALFLLLAALASTLGQAQERFSSEAYDLEVEIATDRMTAALEPIMIVLMAAAVGFIVMAIVMPMLSLGAVA